MGEDARPSSRKHIVAQARRTRSVAASEGTRLIAGALAVVGYFARLASSKQEWIAATTSLMSNGLRSLATTFGLSSVSRTFCDAAEMTTHLILIVSRARKARISKPLPR